MQGLSILIPTYGFDCRELVSDLRALCEKSTLNSQYEIIVIDDGSKNALICDRNSKINEWKNCYFSEQSENTGKAILLNRAVKRAIFPFVLLIDCDAKVCSELFITNYLKVAEAADVICGSIITSKAYLRTANKLRFKYEMAANRIRKQKFMNAHPYNYFTTFNVLLKKNIFDQIQFNEEIRSYGYEDTLFGLDLKNHCITIKYIENPLIHTGIDDNETFLLKTETALQNIANLSPSYEQIIKVSRIYNKLKSCGLASVVKVWHHIFGTIERKQLCSKYPSLILFMIYKLGYYACLPKNHHVAEQHDSTYK